MAATARTCPPVRNRIGWRQRLARLGGSPIDLDLRGLDAPLDAVARLEPEVARLSDAALTQRAGELRAHARAGTALDELQPELFALAREASGRTLGLRPFDVQVVAALALARSRVVEMQTGEGKTLAAVMPAALHALSGHGVHVLTFNDYLARRDADWMGPVYRMLGLSVAAVQQGMAPAARRRAYRADVTYVTAKEAGFDHLRDLRARDPDAVVHRPFHMALVDEADSLLIDEARTPLVLAGRAEPRVSPARSLVAQVAALRGGVDFDTDEYGRSVELTEAGLARMEGILGVANLHDSEHYPLLTAVNCALHARILLRRDVDYLVRGGRIDMIDELTGRVVPDRHWPDGLQAALEAKEGLAPEADGRILGSLPLQHYLRDYPFLCGMTGTAGDAAAELRELYGLEVVVVPTNRPLVRVDRADVVFTHREAKERAVVDEVRRVHALRRPVLVGTLTVVESERLAGRLREAGVACEVLNARNDAAEAAIVARAGRLDAVTISTNMAGRGTDIRLGGGDEAERGQVAALGGLFVIGTNRHESRRVDLQLRGRAGRQGDPGESRFFVSLEDELLVRYGLGSLIPARVMPPRRDEPIEHPVIRREIARAQRIIEGQDHEIRRTLSRYTEIVEDQRRRLMERRQALLHGRAAPDVWPRVPDRYRDLVEMCGGSAVRRAEVAVTLHHLDQAWADHLARCADLREGIHLVRLGQQDPLTRFTAEVVDAYDQAEAGIDDAVRAALDSVRTVGGRLDLAAAGVEAEDNGPAATWTYLVNDDPFRDQVGQMLTGPGRGSIAIFSAMWLMPLMITWGLVDRYLRKRLSTT